MQTSLDIIATLREKSGTLNPELGVQLTTRSGVHTGMVIAGRMGTAEFGEETAVVGMTPNIAARLKEQAQPGRVVVSDATRERIGPHYDTAPLGEVDLKGISHPMTIHAVVGPRLDPDVAVRSDAFGRDTELARMETAWNQVSLSRPTRISLIGPPGIGKSTIVQAFLKKEGRAKHAALTLNGLEFEKDIPFRSLHRTLLR